MKRQDLEHLIRASSDITKEYELVVIGSQAILGTDPNPPAELTVSAEADIYPLNKPELAHEIDVHIGEGSAFHELNGYYAQGVGVETAKLPAGWRERVVRVPDLAHSAGVAYCIGALDLFMSKAAAGREKDQTFCMLLLEHGYLRVSEALATVSSMPADVDQRSLAARIRRWVTLAREAGRVIPDA